MNRLKEFFEDYKAFVLIVFGLISVCFIIWHWHYQHPCIKGHTEQQEVSEYTWIGKGYYYLGSHTENVFVCDCRTTRDSLENYYKLK